MNCVNCGAKLPENVTTCPECGTENTAPRETPAAENAERARTVPQRPRTEYPGRRRTVKNEEKAEKKPRVKINWRIIILILVILGLIAAAIYFAPSILNNGQEEPNLDVQDDQPSTEGSGTTNDDTDNAPDTAEPDEPAIFDVVGVWVWDADSALMRETVWEFAEDGTLTIHYFGLNEPENPFEAWPETYEYEKETGTLILGGEYIKLTWKNENAFSINSAALGVCDSKRTDVQHIPTGAVDIRDVKAGAGTSTPTPDVTPDEPDQAYYFADSDSRYLTRAECEALTKDELRFARNEIYARHGRRFDSEDLQKYFDAQSWYNGTTDPADFDYDSLNAYERANVNLMKSIEDSRK